MSRKLYCRPDGLKAAETFESGRTVRYGYDALGRLASVTEALAGGELVTGYTYDELGNKTSQTDAEGRMTRRAAAATHLSLATQK